MSQQTESNIKSFTAGTALEAYRRVKLTGAYTVGYAGAGESCIGVTQEAAASGAQVSVKMLAGGGGSFKITCSDAVTLSSGQKALYGTANGKVDSSASGVSQFNALQAADGDASVIESIAVLAPGASTVANRVDTIALQDIKLPTLLQLAATAASGVWGIAAGTHGSASATLIGEAANGNSKTSVGRFTYVVPSSYTAGTNLTVRIRTKVTATASTSSTIDVTLFASDKEGGVGSDLCATAAQAVTNAYANKDFTITGTTLSPGDRLDIAVTSVNNDTGGTQNSVATVGDIRVLLTETVVP